MDYPWIEQLTLTNFRNYRQARIDVTPEPVVLCGHNGAGKTNVLEAISLLSPGRGLRNAKLSQIDCQLTSDAPDLPFAGVPWAIHTIIDHPTNGETTIATGRDGASESDKRIIKIDNELQRGQASLASVISVIGITPDMDQTFTDGSTSRRAYLDKLTTIFFPEHVKHLSIYEHAKSERRKLLLKGRADPIWIDTLEQRMAEKGVAIASARSETCRHLSGAIAKQHEENPALFPKAGLYPTGLIEDEIDLLAALEAEQLLKEKLEDSRATDTATGRTNVGPHRSDFVVIHPVKGLRAEICSTGEQKALLLSITIAAVRAKTTWTGISPILLLDEATSHLDGKKRDALLNEIIHLPCQSWLTGTESDLFKFMKGKVQFLTVENAQIMG